MGLNYENLLVSSPDAEQQWILDALGEFRQFWAEHAQTDIGDLTMSQFCQFSHRRGIFMGLRHAVWKTRKPALNVETIERRLTFRVFFGMRFFVIAHIPIETAQ